MFDVMRYEDKRVVSYSFMLRLGDHEHEVRGKKTLKLFRSWFRLVCNWHYKYMPYRREVLYGVVRFIDNDETWIWQNKNRVVRGGWQLALRGKPIKKDLIDLENAEIFDIIMSDLK